MFCTKCGAEGNDRFCAYCGAEMPQPKDNKFEANAYNNSNNNNVVNNYYYADPRLKQSGYLGRPYPRNAPYPVNNPYPDRDIFSDDPYRNDPYINGMAGNDDYADHSPKSRFVALVLCIFLGFFGAHYFYVGKSGMGVLYIFTIGLFYFGWFYDIYRIATGVFPDSNGLLLKR